MDLHAREVCTALYIFVYEKAVLVRRKKNHKRQIKGKQEKKLQDKYKGAKEASPSQTLTAKLRKTCNYSLNFQRSPGSEFQIDSPSRFPEKLTGKMMPTDSTPTTTSRPMMWR